MTVKDSEAERCFICGYDNPNGLHEHHVVPQEFGGSDQPENLVWLCASCHQSIHKLYGKSFYERLDVSSRRVTNTPSTLDAMGEEIDPRRSKARQIPESSPHVDFQEFKITIGLGDLDWCVEEWSDLPEWDEVPSTFGRVDYIVSKLEEYCETAERELDDDDLLYTFPIKPENWRTDPLIVVRGDCSALVEEDGRYKLPSDKRGNDSDRDLLVIPDPHQHERIHCGYCHSVFAGFEHENAARHLRIYHAIDEPYISNPQSGISKHFTNSPVGEIRNPTSELIEQSFDRPSFLSSRRRD